MNAIAEIDDTTMMLSRKTGNIFLIGLMGAGKTSIGRCLAKRIGKRFVDSDREIEARTGVSVATIFEVEGEAGFRRREAAVIREFVEQENIVLATGGGSVLMRENRECLKRFGTVVYLRTSIDETIRRIGHDKSRPLLKNVNLFERLSTLTQQRESLYREVADFIIDADHRDIQMHVNAILDRIQLMQD